MVSENCINVVPWGFFFLCLKFTVTAVRAPLLLLLQIMMSGYLEKSFLAYKHLFPFFFFQCSVSFKGNFSLVVTRLVS